MCVCLSLSLSLSLCVCVCVRMRVHARVRVSLSRLLRVHACRVILKPPSIFVPFLPAVSVDMTPMHICVIHRQFVGATILREHSATKKSSFQHCLSGHRNKAGVEALSHVKFSAWILESRVFRHGSPSLARLQLFRYQDQLYASCPKHVCCEISGETKNPTKDVSIADLTHQLFHFRGGWAAKSQRM